MCGGLVTDASGARSYLSRSFAHRAARHGHGGGDTRLRAITINGGKVERGHAGMKARSHAGESDMREISRRNCGGATGSGVRLSSQGAARRGVLRQAAATAPLAEPARISIRRTAPTTLRNRRLCKACRCQLAARYTAGRKSGTRRSGAAARAASARPRLK